MRFLGLLEFFRLPWAHVAGAGELPLPIAPEKMLVFFESLPYTGLEIGLKNFFTYGLARYSDCKNWEFALFQYIE